MKMVSCALVRVSALVIFLLVKLRLKGDIQFSPEEKLLRAIFGEKSREVRDTSLKSTTWN